MAVEKLTTKVSVALTDADRHFSYRFSSVSRDAADEDILEFGKAINSLQDTPAQKITKSVESMMNYIED
jgi:hypothetical protein